MYSEIFKEVVSITHHDYSGCIDKKGWDDPTTYLQTIEKLERQGELTPVQFTEIVRDYLLDFKDNHMFFKMISTNQPLNSVGFQVKKIRRPTIYYIYFTGNKSEKGTVYSSIR